MAAAASTNRFQSQPFQFTGPWGADIRTMGELDERRVRCQNIKEVCLLAMAIAVIVVEAFLTMNELVLIPLFFFATIIFQHHREEEMLTKVIQCARSFNIEASTVDPKIVQKCWEYGCVSQDQLTAWKDKKNKPVPTEEDIFEMV